MANQMFKDFKYSIIDSTVPKCKTVSVVYKYNGVLMRRFIFIKEKKGLNYINEAKKIIEVEINNGKLEKFSKKYAKSVSKSKDHKKVVAFAFVSLAAVTFAGLFTWKYLTSGGSGDIPVTSANSVVIFDLDGGKWSDGSTEIKTVSVVTGSTVEMIEDVPTRGNEQFVWWSTEKGKNVQYDFINTPVNQKQLHLYAYYEEPIVADGSIFTSATVGCKFDEENQIIEKGKEYTFNLKALEGFQLKDKLQYVINGATYAKPGEYEYTLGADKKTATLKLKANGNVFVKALTKRIDGTPAFRFTTVGGDFNGDGIASFKRISFACTKDSDEDIKVILNDEVITPEPTPGSSEIYYSVAINESISSTLDVYGNLNTINFANISRPIGSYTSSANCEVGNIYTSIDVGNPLITKVEMNQDLGEPKQISTLISNCENFSETVYSNLSEVKIADTVRCIPPYAFSCTPYLSKIDLGNGLESISSNAFYLYDNLSSSLGDIIIKLPNSLQTIEKFGIGGFTRSGALQLNSYNAASETRVYIYTTKDSFPEGFDPMWSFGDTTITLYGMGETPSFRTKTYDDDINGHYTFIANAKNEAFLIKYNNLSGDDLVGKDFKIPGNFTKDGVNYKPVYIAPFFDHIQYDTSLGAGINNLIIPNTIKYIAECAFDNSSFNLTGLQFENESQLIEIGSGAFRWVYTVTEDVHIPSGVKYIDDCAFSRFAAGSPTPGPINSINPVLPDCISFIFDKDSDGVNHLEFIGARAFEENGLNGFEIPANVSKLGTRILAYSYLKDGTHLTVDKNNAKYTDLNDDLVYDKTNDTLVTASRTSKIPETTKTIGAYALADTTYAETSLEIPASVEKIEEGAFNGFNFMSLTNASTSPSFTFAKNSNLTYIGSFAFGVSFMTGVQGLELPNKVNYIGDRCFSRSYAPYVILPSSLLASDAYVGDYIIESWNSLQYIKVPFSSNESAPSNWSSSWSDGHDGAIICHSDEEPGGK